MTNTSHNHATPQQPSSQNIPSNSSHTVSKSLPANHLTVVVEDQPNKPPRKGFDSADFKPHSSKSNLSFHQNSSLSSLSTPSIAHESLRISPRQRLYDFIDSTPATILSFLLMAFDFCFFLTAHVYTLLQTQPPHVLTDVYFFIDWITAVMYIVEVNLRLFAYGPYFYFHGVLRSIDYVISCTNALFVLIYTISPDQWLLITRLIRTLRMLTSLTIWRERNLKGRTRQELESLAQLLEREKSDRSKLTKWKIDPGAIAIGERAGGGAFGTVFSGLFRGTLVAVKQLSYLHQEKSVYSIEDEAITLVNLRHPNVVLFMGFVHEPQQLWIVTEYCSRGSLRDILDDNNLKLTQGRILKLALGAARGLAYLHGQDPPVLHLDLKTSNILISSGWDAKLGDFGLSRSIDKIEKDWFSGTMQYAAPEILEANAFSTAADIYSFGICLWEMAAREVPFHELSPMSVLWGVVKSRLRPSLESIAVSPAMSHGKSNQRPTKKGHKSLSSEERGCADPPLANVLQKIQAGQHRDIRVSTVLGTEEGLERLSPDKIFEKVEENDRTANNMMEPVTASIVGGFVLPSGVNAIGRKTFPGDQNGHEDRERLKEQESLSGLTHKVTATIQLFDERPPIIRKRGGDGSNDYGGQSKSESIAGSLSAGQSVRGRRNLIEKSSLRRQFSTLRSSNRMRHSSSRNESGLKRDEEDPFLRRLASVSKGAFNNEAKADQTGEGKSECEVSAAIEDSECNSNNDKHETPAVFPEQAKVPKEYVDLIQKCWSHDPNERPSAGEIVWRLVILIDSQMREK